ncbi:MAG TPA: ArsA-related P-loop ATPase [Myxococcales bacterium]|nr:ArsA-related P-loop ATPase [Myxococcales bacterium]
MRRPDYRPYDERPALDEVLARRRVLCCVGSGGVGKTTTAAALALRAAMAGQRAVVLTIDPARRLANSLGLKALGNRETRIESEVFRAAGLHPRGEMYAMMLDLKLTWDELVQRQAPSPERAQRILDNRLYQKLSTAMAGSLEYMAMEKVYELHSSGRFDVVVLDTPPTANALDFLHAPDRILDVLDNDAMRVVLGPVLKASRIGLRLFALPTGLVLRTLAKFTGQDFLRDLANFMIAFEGMYEGFKDRAGKVKRLLSGPETAFILVTGPNPLTIEEALFFHRALQQDGISTAAVVVNRVQRDPHRFSGPDSAPALSEALQLARISDAGNPPLSQRLARTLVEQATLADLDRRQVEELSRRLSAVPLFVVPQLRRDVHDLGGLWQIDECLSAAEE